MQIAVSSLHYFNRLGREIDADLILIPGMIQVCGQRLPTLSTYLIY
jgi:hypothetical protein